ncbi:multidrug ABC-transporter [Rhizobium rhizogenes K84]|jgi:ATP-binding cassette subfamily B protein RaxB|uniref:Multidrug ABC-transporter n=1 Tax=Rhizobium rhizogenes (strain K84 / ATCC BAA-868) TaxID=311403 RepID=B9JLQ6_RHIR8|nr:multidrug ABC-transporter [Rhizobium rhizogenes K84]
MREVGCQQHGRLRGRHRSPHYGASREKPSNVCLARCKQTRGAIVLADDDATRHIELGNERNVSSALGDFGITQIIIAHRPETIAKAGRVVYIREINRPNL